MYVSLLSPCLQFSSSFYLVMPFLSFPPCPLPSPHLTLSPLHPYRSRHFLLLDKDVPWAASDPGADIHSVHHSLLHDRPTGIAYECLCFSVCTCVSPCVSVCPHVYVRVGVCLCMRSRYSLLLTDPLDLSYYSLPPLFVISLFPLLPLFFVSLFPPLLRL